MGTEFALALGVLALLLATVAVVWGPTVFGAEKIAGASSFLPAPPGQGDAPPLEEEAPPPCEPEAPPAQAPPPRREARTASALLAQMGGPWD